MKNLKKLRKMADMTQFSLSKKARVHRSKIADTETERASLTAAERRRVLAVLADRIAKNLEEVDASLQAVESEAEAVAAVGS